ncbi:MAG: hypothetical protein QHJ82_11055 [Verrucomicrobiota bacterium]|jgi:predicted nucleic acid-binding protein|nr:hypothetical protein [Verrucomicrobiota bacterium]
MRAVSFPDTNILLYAYDLDAPAKRSVALRLVEEGGPPTARPPSASKFNRNCM